MPRVSWNFMGNLAFPLPPLPEQQAIATYLDKATAKIDALIAEQEKLCTLLAEKRKALISHVVTKGLDPKAKLKPSGISWLGDIPEHWDMKALSLLCNQIGDIDHKMPVSEEYGIPYISASDFTENGIDFENSKKITRDCFNELSKKIKPEKGDLIFARYASMGLVRLVTVSFDFLVSYSCAILKPKNETTDSKYLFYYLVSEVLKHQIQFYANTNTQSNIGTDSIRRFKILSPPLPEQQAIAAYLDKATAKLDALAAKAEEGIALLKERRSALISEVVTGKVRVA